MAGEESKRVTYHVQTPGAKPGKWSTRLTETEECEARPMLAWYRETRPKGRCRLIRRTIITSVEVLDDDG